ncbi:MAG: hypothetical protein JXR68_09835 [Bacteroidales bacterium]|nr:hypothetical protein [Bacteroidales bacterium]
MKKIISLLFTLVILVSSFFAQDLTSLYSEIAGFCGQDIANKFQLQQQEILQQSGNKANITIVVLPLKNHNDEFTQISKNLSPQFANEFQQKIKTTFSAFDNITVLYSEDENDYPGCDFIFNASYFISGNNFIINNISLQTPRLTYQKAFDQSVCSLTSTENLIQINYALVAKDIDQLSRAIALQYRELDGLHSVKLNNFVNALNQLPSQFSELLAQQLESDFISLAQFSVERNLSRSLNSTTRYEISGTYIKEGNKLKVTSTLKDPANDVTLGTAKAFISLDYFSGNGIKYEPDNQQQVKQQQDVFDDNSVQNDFDIDVWTNKGNQNVVFKEGDTLELYLVSSKECYIRVVNIWADGTKILLVDNEQISALQVGQPYKYPISFTCSGPSFGAETFIVFAQVGSPFAPLNTTDHYGLKKVEDDLDDVLSRSFTPNILKAQKHIYMVTMP